MIEAERDLLQIIGRYTDLIQAHFPDLLCTGTFNDLGPGAAPQGGGGGGWLSS